MTGSAALAPRAGPAGAPAVAAALRDALSEQRLRPFLREAGGLPGALRLYRWDMAVSSAMFEVLGTVEVAVRNAVDGELCAAAPGGRWWERAWWPVGPAQRGDLERAVVRAAGFRDRHSAVVAHLGFGFWTDLLSERYEPDLWSGGIRRAFPGLPAGQGRADVHRPLTRLHSLRNRIAHHEPVHAEPLAALHDDALTVLDAVCAVTREWTARTSRLPALLEQDPRRGRGSLAAAG